MTAEQILQTISSVFKDAWKRHRVALAMMVAAVLDARRLGTTEIGRALPTATVPKHAIKRVDRWLGNRRFDDKKAREQFLRMVVGPRPRVLVAIAWTKLRRWPVLVAGIVHRGRAVPVLWSVADPEKLKDWRYGMRAGHILVRNAARVERVLLVASLVLFLALLVGAAARQCGLDRGYRANTVRTRPTHSDFALGIYYAPRTRWNQSILLDNFYLEGWAVVGG